MSTCATMSGSFAFPLGYTFEPFGYVVEYGPNPLCEACGKAEATIFDYDPYAANIDGCFDYEWQCSECYGHRLDDI